MMVRLALAILFSIFMSLNFARAADEGARVVLVLDASGSMWGQIDGKSKMEIAKAVVGKVVGNWKPADELGLVVYGHREKGSCADIEVVREAGVIDAGDFMGAVNALNPKGKTPMTAAVRMAAESLKYTEKKATVILVSDGIETCGLDPCAIAEEMEKLGVGLTVHTVGFGLDNPNAVGQLKCLAEKTGGIATTASNAEELEDALNKTVAVKEDPPPPVVVDEFKMRGHVTMAAGLELPEDLKGAIWEFYDTVDGVKGQWVKTEYGADIKTNLEKSGNYIVRVYSDYAAIEVPVVFDKDKPQKLALSLEAGIVRFSGFMDDATPMTDAGAAWEVRNATDTWITTKYGAESQFLLNAGSHRVVLSLGNAKAEQKFDIVAGKTLEQKVSLGAGLIEVSGFFTAGGQAIADGAAIELRKAEPDLDGKHEWIATEYGATVKFKAPAGKYQIVVIQDYAKAETEVTVTAGGLVKVDVVLNAGYLAIQGPADSTIEVFKDEKDLSGKRAYLATDYGALNKAFPAGNYYVTMKGKDGAELGAKSFVVTAGSRTEGTLP
jgi:Ca-activated chloride channel homolog